MAAERDQAALARALAKEAQRREADAQRDARLGRSPGADAAGAAGAAGPASSAAGAGVAGAGGQELELEAEEEALEALSDEENDTPRSPRPSPSPTPSRSRSPSPSGRHTGRRIRKLSKTIMQNLKKAASGARSHEDLASEVGSARERASTGSVGNPNEILHGFERLDMDPNARNPNDLPEGCVVIGYHVQNGDTINGVAMRHAMTVGQFRQLNKMFGSASLFPGQTVLVMEPPGGSAGATGASAVSDAALPPPVLVRQRSKLGGAIYEDVTLVDQNIQIGGTLEVNAYYVGFTASHVTGAHASQEVCSSTASARLAKSYQFRLDIRDIQGCSASELQPETHAAGASAPSSSAAPGGGTASHNFCMRVYWTFPSAGFMNPPPLTFFARDHESCAALVTDIQTEVQRQQNKSARLANFKLDESESITGGAVISGLLCKPDQVRSSEITEHPVDLVQHALLNGEVSEEEARILRVKNREVEDRMAALAEAQRAAELEEAQRARKASSPLTIISNTAAKATGHRGSINSDGSNDAPERKLAVIETKVLPHFSNFPSSIIEDDQELIDINRELPDRLRNKSWVISYSSNRQGVSLKQLYRHASGNAETLMLCETRTGEKFGCFASEMWTPTRPREFYGTGESFVFSLRPDLCVYKWTGANDFIMSSSASHIGMGGGGGFAFWLDEDLDCGSTSKCETFGNKEPILLEPEFRLSQIELITFESKHRRGSVASEGETRYLFSPDNS
ncbi:Oxidation resistance protein 1 [Hondaea fermentalgiana]|uniref:Oxidation resistance protein 1 n=1 Tax=Hondaea fermentalgiana TaxID=2315210 RepID=A0A2R5GK24_9STRA|nr:Oxidation resistance protein 1 [Hondaea fermentalgiana]|eukprot:GBG31227.1 Oxidation resistance protein 1 [Hondaea fermentalgiana]